MNEHRSKINPPRGKATRVTTSERSQSFRSGSNLLLADLPISVPVVSGLNLQTCHSSGLTDSEVKVDIQQPNDFISQLNKQQTNGGEKTLNPQFNEKLAFR
jgi:hypothetical protein